MANYANRVGFAALLAVGAASAFNVPTSTIQRQHPLYALTTDDDAPKTIKAASLPDQTPLIVPDADDDKATEGDESAATGTINDRLMVELQEAADKEKFGAKSGVGKKLSLTGRPTKTPEEQEKALREARDLNGVNPAVALGGGLFAFAAAGALWYATTELGTFFALHPVETDVYFVQRLASVFRNLVMGLASLASGFFGVTGMGIFLLGVRVAVGVAKGELDPTPIKKKQSDSPKMPDVWDLMMNKKPNRRGGRGGGDNMFGL